ncbi:hypothetical protein KCU83_g108, partial [Aureobasidium melanogenum]
MRAARYRNHAHALKSDFCGVLASVVDPVSVVPVASLVLASVDLNHTGPSSAATCEMSISACLDSPRLLHSSAYSVSLLVIITSWPELTYELVLPDSGVHRGCGSVNPRSSHGSHLRCGFAEWIGGSSLDLRHVTLQSPTSWTANRTVASCPTWQASALALCRAVPPGCNTQVCLRMIYFQQQDDGSETSSRFLRKGKLTSTTSSSIKDAGCPRKD